MNKEDVLKEFSSFDKKKRDLNDKLESLSSDYSLFLSRNRKVIKKDIIPKVGSVYRLKDTYTNNCYRANIMYCKVKATRVVSKGSGFNWGYRDELSLPVSVYLLDSDFNNDGSDYETVNYFEIDIEKEEQKLKKDKATNVYLMIDKNTGLYKVGRSINPSTRERTLQSEKPTIEIIYYHPAINSDEKHFHCKFKDKRVRGEWFSLDYSDIEYVKQYFIDKLNG
jgi:hypothetical protein